jgi:hypothetical protein
VERRLSALEQRLGPAPDLGRLVVIAPNAWSDADRDAWERSRILHDQELHDDLIEKHTGYRPRHRPGVIEVMVVPAPLAIEQADEATRAQWRARRN